MKVVAGGPGQLAVSPKHVPLQKSPIEVRTARPIESNDMVWCHGHDLTIGSSSIFISRGSSMSAQAVDCGEVDFSMFNASSVAFSIETTSHRVAYGNTSLSAMPFVEIGSGHIAVDSVHPAAVQGNMTVYQAKLTSRQPISSASDKFCALVDSDSSSKLSSCGQLFADGSRADGTYHYGCNIAVNHSIFSNSEAPFRALGGRSPAYS